MGLGGVFDNDDDGAGSAEMAPVDDILDGWKRSPNDLLSRRRSLTSPADTQGGQFAHQLLEDDRFECIAEVNKQHWYVNVLHVPMPSSGGEQRKWHPL